MSNSVERLNIDLDISDNYNDCDFEEDPSSIITKLETDGLEKNNGTVAMDDSFEEYEYDDFELNESEEKNILGNSTQNDGRESTKEIYVAKEREHDAFSPMPKITVDERKVEPNKQEPEKSSDSEQPARHHSILPGALEESVEVVQTEMDAKDTIELAAPPSPKIHIRRRGSVMMAMASTSSMTAKFNGWNIIDNFDPRSGVPPKETAILNACKCQGILPSELVLKTFGEFRGQRGEIPIHIAKIRFEHHKNTLKELLLLVRNELDKRTKVVESNVCLTPNDMSLSGDDDVVSAKTLPRFLKNEDGAPLLPLTQKDVKALQKSFAALKRDEEDLKEQIFCFIKQERKERTRISNLSEKQQEITSKQMAIAAAHSKKIMGKKEQLQEHNKLQWLHVQQVFLTKWINQDLAIKEKEKRQNDRKAFEERQLRRKLEELEKKRLAAADKQFITRRMRRIRLFRAEQLREETRRKNETIERRIKTREKIVQQKRYAAEQAHILRSKIEDEKRIADVRNNWTKLEQIYERLGAPSSSPKTILIQDQANTFQTNSTEISRALRTRNPKRKVLREFERFQSPIPSNSEHAIDLLTAMVPGNFEKIQSHVYNGNIKPLLANPQELHKILSFLKVDRVDISQSHIAKGHPPSKNQSRPLSLAKDYENIGYREKNKFEYTPSRPGTSVGSPDFLSRASTASTTPKSTGLGGGGRQTIRSAGKRRDTAIRPKHLSNGRHGRVYRKARPISGPGLAKQRIRERYKVFRVVTEW
jgi:hypothetical protein